MKYNQKDYKFYVIYSKRNNGLDSQIESGWEFKDDAIDRIKEMKEDYPLLKLTVWNKKSTIRNFGNLNNEHWETE